MLLVAYFDNIKWCKIPEKRPKPLHIGTYLGVLSESYSMNTSMTGFIWFTITLCILMFWTKVASALEGLRFFRFHTLFKTCYRDVEHSVFLSIICSISDQFCRGVLQSRDQVHRVPSWKRPTVLWRHTCLYSIPDGQMPSTHSGQPSNTVFRQYHIYSISTDIMHSTGSSILGFIQIKTVHSLGAIFRCWNDICRNWAMYNDAWCSCL